MAPGVSAEGVLDLIDQLDPGVPGASYFRRLNDAQKDVNGVRSVVDWAVSWMWALSW